MRDGAKAFAADQLQPRVADAFESEVHDAAIFKKMGAAGLLGITVPEQYGGLGAGYVTYGLIAREIERVDSGYRSMMSVQSSLVIYPIFAYCSEAQKQRYLPKLIAGELVGCFGLTEPDAGSDAEVDFHGQKRLNDTHASTTDPEARLYRKGRGKEAKLCFMGHGLMENRHGLLVDACLTPAGGHAERVAALHMIEPRADRPQAITLAADKAYDAEDFVNELRTMNVSPHVAQNTGRRRSAIDGRTTRHAGYAASQRLRKRIEEAFGWIKTIAGQKKTRFRGCDRVGWAFTFAAAAYNLVRLPKLIAAPT